MPTLHDGTVPITLIHRSCHVMVDCRCPVFTSPTCIEIGLDCNHPQSLPVMLDCRCPVYTSPTSIEIGLGCNHPQSLPVMSWWTAGAQCSRLQLPLKLALAVTIHKAHRSCHVMVDCRCSRLQLPFKLAWAQNSRPNS